MILTRKIELGIIEDDKQKFIEKWQFMRQLSIDVFQAANLIISNSYFNDSFADRIVLTDSELKEKSAQVENDLQKISDLIKSESDKDVREKLKEKRNKIFKIKSGLTKEARKKMQEFYTRSESTELYHLINLRFPKLPSVVSSSLVNKVLKEYKNDWVNVKQGKTSIRSYKNGMPIPFLNQSIIFEKLGNQIILNWVHGNSFFLRFGRDKSNNRILVERIMSGGYKASDSSIQIDGNKIFLLLCVDIPFEQPKLNPEICVGVDLGISIPVYCGLSEGYERLSLGSAQDFQKVRLRMQMQKRRLQGALKISNGGHGRKKKMKALENSRSNESNWVKTYNHNISAQVINFAKKNNAGVIKLEFLEGFGEEEKNKFILRNWSYFQLQTMIEYKAKKFGISIVYVDPYHTSQTCSCCGNYEDGQRLSQSQFLCKNPDCSNKENGENKIVNADYNASLNIAKSTKFVEKKTDCEYHKKYSEESELVL